MKQTNEVVKQNTAATQRYHGHVKLQNQMALLMVLDKSPFVPYAVRSLRGGGGSYSNIRVLPDYFLLKWIIFKVCEHEYMNKCPYPIIDPCTALIPFTVNSLDFGENNKTK